MIDGHSGVAECGTTGRLPFFLPYPYGLGFCSSEAHPPPAADPSCHLMPAEHEINRHSWYKQARRWGGADSRSRPVRAVEPLDGETCG